MHILQLCPRVPYPLSDGGRISMYHITRALARRGHVIDMIAFAEEDTTEAHLAALRELCTVQLVHANNRTNLRNFIRGALRNESVYIARHRSHAFFAAVREALRRVRYDVVYGDHSAMFPYLIEAHRAGFPAVARLHNVENVIWHRYARDERNPVKRFLAKRQALMLEHYEGHAARLIDANFTITEIDQARMERLAPGARVLTVFPGVDTDAWVPVPHDRTSAIALTATTFSWIHNVNGVLWFLDHVMPRVLRDVPEFALDLLGRSPPPVLLRRASDRVRVLGFVEDMLPVAARAGVYIVPLHVGSGIRIKILEAMAMGMAVVTTSVGCEGIPGVHGTHFLIADTAEDFARAVTDVLTNPDRAESIGRAARAFVVERFNWDAAANAIEQEMRAIIARRAMAKGED